MILKAMIEKYTWEVPLNLSLCILKVLNNTQILGVKITVKFPNKLLLFNDLLLTLQVCKVKIILALSVKLLTRIFQHYFQ